MELHHVLGPPLNLYMAIAGNVKAAILLLTEYAAMQNLVQDVCLMELMVAYNVTQIIF